MCVGVQPHESVWTGTEINENLWCARLVEGCYPLCSGVCGWPGGQAVIKVSLCCHDDCDPNALLPGDAPRRRMGEIEIKIEGNKVGQMIRTVR